MSAMSLYPPIRGLGVHNFITVKKTPLFISENCLLAELYSKFGVAHVMLHNRDPEVPWTPNLQIRLSGNTSTLSPDFGLCNFCFFPSVIDEAEGGMEEVFNGHKVCQQLSFQSSWLFPSP